MAGFRRFVLIMTAIMSAVLYHSSVSAENDRELFPSESDSAYIESFKHLLTTRYYLLAQNGRLTIFPVQDAVMIYEPNEPGRMGLAGFYKWFGIGLSMGSKLFRKDPDTYGNTKIYDVRINAYGKFAILEGYLQYYKGFYMDYRSDDLDGIYIIPGMEMISFGIDMTYIYNHARFSIRASFVQNERQKKSAGSLIVKPVFRYYHVNSDTGIIPGEVLNLYSLSQENIVSGNFYTFGLGPGYAYTFVFLKNFYITAGALLEANWSFYNYRSTDQTHASNGFCFPGSLRVALGYNSDKWFIGASYLSTLFYLQPGQRMQDDFHYNLTQIRFWVGTRFNAFKKWNKKK